MRPEVLALIRRNCCSGVDARGLAASAGETCPEPPDIGALVLRNLRALCHQQAQDVPTARHRILPSGSESGAGDLMLVRCKTGLPFMSWQGGGGAREVLGITPVAEELEAN
jgi:hypothetical protein